ncbi:MAG: rplC [Gammaproteobacteria bacterium]|jgi:large subunit ribosomal protein L3|nr:rplC [Gammaproteobacteria bacterium]
MTIGLIGSKVGMTRVFTEDGVSIPVTVLHVQPNMVTQIKTIDNDGYDAIQVTTGTRRASRITKPAAGHVRKAGVAQGRTLKEFRLSAEESSRVGENAPAENAIKLGTELTLSALFTVGQSIDVTGTSKGKGFAGTVKRHNFRTQDATHGNSLSHRVPGSTGQNQTPGRVFKGKKMAGHLGDERVSVQSLEVVRIDIERNLLLVKGAVPGAPGGDVMIKPAVKAKTKTTTA